MTDARSRRAEEIFQELVELTPGSWGPALAERCGSDGELRGEVEALLRHGALASPLFLGGGAAAGGLPGVPTPDLVGRHIGRYRILREIGAGGMGTVYEAEQEAPRRHVAVKVLASGLASRDALRRFRYEAEVLGRLSHPGIARILEAGMHGEAGVGVPYFAMEFVEGARSIRDFAREESLTVARRLVLFTGVCDAVQHGHQNGVIHRDLKPSNILVDGAGRPKVIDFGIARATEADVAVATRATEVGQLVGTLQYMSPEQCLGDSTKIDTRSDVYALGVVLFELLTGRLPYDTESLSYFDLPRLIREQSPRSPSGFDRTLRGDVETILLRALEKNRERRYASVTELAEDVRLHLAGKPIRARRDSRWYVLRRTLAQHKLGVVIAGSFLVFLAVAAASLAVLYDRSETRGEDLRRSLYHQQVAGAFERYRDLRGVGRHLEQCAPDLRGWEWYHLDWIADTSARTFPVRRGWVSSLAPSPDGAQVVVGGLYSLAEGRIVRVLEDEDLASESPTLMTVGLTDGAPRVRFGQLSEVRDVDFGTAGALVASAGAGGKLKIWDVASGDQVVMLLGHRKRGTRGWYGGTHAAAFLPDGERIASCGVDGTVMIWSTAPSAERVDEPLAILAGHAGMVQDLALGHDGERLASVGDDGSLRVWDTSNAELLHHAQLDHGLLRVAYSADGASIATGGVDGRVRVWAGDTCAERWSARGHDWRVEGVAFSPDGSMVVSLGGVARVWDSRSGAELGVLRSRHGEPISVAFTPDGEWILTGNRMGELQVFEAEVRSRRPVLREPAVVRQVAFGEDGALLASGGDSGVVRVWDLDLARLVHELSGHAAPVRGLAFHPDRSSLITADQAGVLRRWDLTTGETRTLAELGQRVAALTLDPAGERLVVACPDGTLRVLDVERGEELHVLRAHGNEAVAVVFGPDGSTIASAGGPREAGGDERVLLWDAERGVLRRALGTHASAVWSVDFDPTGRLLAASARFEGQIHLWDVSSGAESLTIGDLEAALNLGHGAPAVAFGADGRRVFAGTVSGEVVVYDARSGEPIVSLRGHHGEVHTLAVSPDGRRVASAGEDRTIRIWDAGSGWSVRRPTDR